MTHVRALALAVTLIGTTLPACSDESEPGGTAGGGGTATGTGAGTAGGAATGGGTNGGGGVGGGTGGSGAGGPDLSIIPADRRVEWRPGVPGGIGDVATVCPSSAPTVTSFGAVGNGTTNDAAAFQAAIDAAAPGSAIRIPAGTYLLQSGLDIDKGVVLCGEGPSQSRLVFDTNDPGIRVVKYDRGDWIDVTSGYTKDSTQLELPNASEFSVGDHGQIKQTNNWDAMDPEGVWRNSSWVPDDCVGQIFEVVAVSGNTLTIDPPLHIDFEAAYDPVVRRLGLIDGVGIQGLHLRRTATGDAATIAMRYAVRSWIRDCVSEDTMTAHVGLSESLWCEIRDSYFHHSHDYGGGGHGYGASLGMHTTASLVENNVFEHLRHSMIIQVGASGNVYGYNYSVDPYADGGGWTPCDISLHGHWPNMNLFEANTVQEVDVSDYWGTCGPGNTFFRLRTESEGIQIMDYSDGQNAVGNTLGTDPNIIELDSTVTEAMLHGNYVDGAIEWDPANSNHDLPPSLYLSSKPAFFGSRPWPISGADLAPNGGKLPAQDRFEGN